MSGVYKKSTSTTTQQDFRTMAEQAEVVAGAQSTLAYPGSIVLGEAAAVGDISFVTNPAKAEDEGALNNQLSSVIAALMAKPQTVPQSVVEASTTKAESGIDSKYITYGLIAIGAIFLLKALR